MFLGVCDEILMNWNPFGVYPTALIAHVKLQDPYISPKKNSSDYRVHGTQNDRLESRVSMQKSVCKNMHRVLRYWQKGIKICRFGLATRLLAYFALISWDSVHFLKNQFLG